jgi:predicted outer membrane repeat protein
VCTNAKKSKFTINTHRKGMLSVSLLFILLSSSFLSCCVLTSRAASFPLEVAELVGNENSLRAAVNRAGESAAVIAISADIKLSAPLVIAKGKDITLKSNGNDDGFFKLIGAPGADTITVEAGGILELAGIILTHTSGTTGTGVTVKPGGTLTLSGGEISGNHGHWGGAVSNRGHFTLSGGKISGNTADYGGGVYNGDSFSLTGGMITQNTANRGGGVVNGDRKESYARFTMSGGEISKNIATDDLTGGGGIAIYGGSFNMTTGIISDNRAPNGGGMHNENGMVRLFGGVISSNNASDNGGGIYVKNLEDLHVFDGVFSDNTASIAYNRNPADDGQYSAHIGKNVTWTAPFKQGYNNYDISYTNGTLYSDSQLGLSSSVFLAVFFALIVGIVAVVLFFYFKKR